MIRMQMKRGRTALAAAVASAAIAGWTALSGAEHQASSAGAEHSASNISAHIAEMLGKVAVVDELPHIPGYERGCGIDKETKFRELCVFGPAWNDPADRSGCDARNRALRVQLHDVVFKPNTHDCKVIDGYLDPDPYTGQRIGLHDIDIDHIVSAILTRNANICAGQSVDYMPLTVVGVMRLPVVV